MENAEQGVWASWLNSVLDGDSAKVPGPAAGTCHWRDQDKKEGEGRSLKQRGRSRSIAENSRKSCDSGTPKAHSVAAPLLLCLVCHWRREALPEGSAQLLSSEGLLRLLNRCLVSAFQEERGWMSRAGYYCRVGDGLGLFQSLFMDLTEAGSKA